LIKDLTFNSELAMASEKTFYVLGVVLREVASVVVTALLQVWLEYVCEKTGCCTSENLEYELLRENMPLTFINSII